MRVLIVYGTVEGQTRKIAEFSADTLRQLGHQVDLFDVHSGRQASLEGVDAVVLAASVHQRRHPPKFEDWISSNRDAVNAVRTLLMSVSLSAAFPEGVEEAGDYVTEMKMRTRFEPSTELLVAGAIRVEEYDYFAMQVLRHVVLRDRDHDPASGHHEFTDWDRLALELGRFFE